MLEPAARARGRADRRERPLSRRRRAREPRLAGRAARGPGRAAAAGRRRRAGLARGAPPQRRLAAAVGRHRAAGRHRGAAHVPARWSATCAGRPGEHRALPFAVDVDGVFAGQVTVNNIVRGSAQFGAGRLLGRRRRYAGRGIMPHRGGAGVRPLLRRWACTGSRSRSGRRTPRACGWWRSSASRESATPRAPAHRRRLARPPALRDHRRGRPGGLLARSCRSRPGRSTSANTSPRMNFRRRHTARACPARGWRWHIVVPWVDRIIFGAIVVAWAALPDPPGAAAPRRGRRGRRSIDRFSSAMRVLARRSVTAPSTGRPVATDPDLGAGRMVAAAPRPSLHREPPVVDAPPSAARPRTSRAAARAAAARRRRVLLALVVCLAVVAVLAGLHRLPLWSPVASRRAGARLADGLPPSGPPGH